MKRSLLLFALAAAIGLAACTEKPDDERGNPEARIAIAPGEITQTSIEVDFTASAGASRFTYYIGSAANAATDAAEFAAGAIGTSVDLAAGAGPTNKKFTGLSQQTEYIVYARAFNGAGEKGSVEQKTISTLAPEPLGAMMEAVYVTRSETKIEMRFRGDDNTLRFTYAMGQPGDLAAFEAGTLAGIETAEWSEEGTFELYEGLTSGTEYTFFARATDRLGLYGETKTVMVRTCDPSAISTEVVLLNCSVARIKFDLSENAVGGITVMLTKTSYDKTIGAKHTEGEKINELLGMVGLFAMTYEADMVHDFMLATTSGKEFMFVNLEQYKDPNGVSRLRYNEMPITTPAINPAAEAGSVEVGIAQSTRQRIEFSFKTNDAAYIVKHKILPKSMFGMVNNEAGYADLLSSGNQTPSGESTYKYEYGSAATVKPGVEFLLFGLIFNENGPSEEIVILKEFVIPEE